MTESVDKQILYVAIPVYPAHLKFKVAAVGESLDPLTYMILQMAKDRRTVDDLHTVTCLPERIINQEINEQESAGLIEVGDGIIGLTKVGKQALMPYVLAGELSNLPYSFFVNGLTHHFFIYHSDMGEIIDTANAVLEKYKNPAIVMNGEIKKRDAYYPFRGTIEALENINEIKGRFRNGELEKHFEITITLDDRYYLMRRIEKYPDFQNRAQYKEKGNYKNQIKCIWRIITYQAMVERNGEPATLNFYIDPKSGIFVDGRVFVEKGDSDTDNDRAIVLPVLHQVSDEMAKSYALKKAGIAEQTSQVSLNQKIVNIPSLIDAQQLWGTK